VAPTWWAAQAVAARTLLEWAKATADEEDAKAERLARSIEYFDEALRLLRAALRDDVVTAATDPADPANGAGGAAGAGTCTEEELVELLNDRGVAHYEAALLESLMTSIIQPGTQLAPSLMTSIIQPGTQLARARESLLEALERRPGHTRALTNLGLVEWCQGHERAAQQAFDRAIELSTLSTATGGEDITTAHAHNNRGARRLSKGEADKAVLDFHTALGIDAWYEAARANRDRALVQLGEPAPLRPVEEMESRPSGPPHPAAASR
jgi:tetratricopeptide (TPR) repeat protein